VRSEPSITDFMQPARRSFPKHPARPTHYPERCRHNGEERIAKENKMVRAKAWFSQLFSVFLITLASVFAAACEPVDEQPEELGEEVSALTSRGNAQLQVDRCMAQFTTDADRKQCIQSAGFSLFDDSGIETADACIPNCICVQQEGCPCCDTGGFFNWVFWPRPRAGVWTPPAAVTEKLRIDVDRTCVGTPENRKAPVTVETRSSSQLASLVDLEIAVQRAGIVAATVSDDGRHHDDRVGDGVMSGLALLGVGAPSGCTELGCHFECDASWHDPQPGEGSCPGHDWWGTGCLYLTNCKVGCGTSSSVDVGIRAASSLFQPNP
jgi:hypothetical protein